MATTYLNLVGKARFIKHIYKPDEAFGASKFKAGIYLDDKELSKYKASGIQVTPKTDELGTYVVLSRDEMKMINKNLVYFTPPYIKNKIMEYIIQYVDADGNQVRQYQNPNNKDSIKRVGEPFLIGNGSLVELNVCVFDTKTKGKGHRLEGIRILDLIEYSPKVNDVSSANYKPQNQEQVSEIVESAKEAVEIAMNTTVPAKSNKKIPF